MDVPSANKRRKLTDKSVPASVLADPTFASDSRMYADLLAMERRLDWTMARKKVEIQDALGRPAPTARTLRLYLSHTVSGQAWQLGAGAEGEEPPAPNFETGEGIPAWQFKIEGRLLEIPGQRPKNQPPTRKFSAFIKHMVVELERDTTLYPEANIVEWQRTAQNAQTPQDGFTIRRTGDQPTKIRVVLHLLQEPEVYRVHQDLGNILGITEETRTGVIQTLWSYIKLQGLQDQVDRKMIRADEKLRPIFNGQESVPFQHLPELVLRYLMPPEPVVLHYNINPAVAPAEKPLMWDVEVKTDDGNLKGRMNQAVLSMSNESAKDLVKLDEEIALLAQSLSNAHTKRTFLREFARDPAVFIQRWLESQSKDLESVLGSGPSEGGTVRQEDLRRSEFFRLPWVEEAVAIHEGHRLASRAS